MALVRWDPSSEITSLQGEMNRLFNTFFAPNGTQTGDGGGSGARQRWIPPMDVYDAGDHFVLKVDLPGMAEEDISIEVESDTLSVSGERTRESKQEGESWYRMERAYGSFMRSVQLPDGVDAESVTAHFDNGVLEVHVPKPEQRKPRKVSIGRARAIEGSGSATS